MWPNTLTVLLISLDVGLRNVLPPCSVHLFLSRRLFTDLTKTHLVLQCSALLGPLALGKGWEARHEACALNIVSLAPHTGRPSGISYPPLVTDQLLEIVWLKEVRFQVLQRGLWRAERGRVTKMKKLGS